jgi:glucosamine--fructose-6-phosphate aminotransferase (isomerizing)
MDSTIHRARRWISGIEAAPELLSASGSRILELECREQPRRLQELICACAADSEIRSMLARIRGAGASSGPVQFLGMGASLCSSIAGSILLQTHGRLSFSVDAGEWLHYGASGWSDDALSILLTTSGESAELVELFRIGKPQKMALICNNSASAYLAWRRILR